MCDLPGIMLTALSLTFLQSPPFPLGWAAAAVTLVLFILAAAALSFFLIRRSFGGRESREARDPALPKPSMDNPSAFFENRKKNWRLYIAAIGNALSKPNA